MAEPRWLNADEQRTWRAFREMLIRLDEALDHQLERDSGMPHAYYMILAMLSEAPGRSLRMSQLASVNSYSLSRLSHAVARLEERGLVRREDCPTDRRGAIAVLTDAGWDVLVAAAPGHVGEIRRRLFDPLTAEEAAMLGTISAKVAQAVRAPV
ncbi:MAG: MarR family transcriptional regulator [Candidatus Dormibacteria bacterium]